MITVRARNFRGVEKADIPCDPIALVAGPNATGKSSIAQAAGALLTGDALPLPGLGKNAAGYLVKVGAPSAAATIEHDAGIARIDWPECRITTDRLPPQASKIAVGLESIATMAAQDRARVLARYLRSDPTRQELDDALGFSLHGLWELIEAKGWDGAHATRKDFGAQLKGQWRGITGQIYGSRVAASWRPDLAEIDEHELALEVERLTAQRDRAIAAAAVTKADHDRWLHEASLLDERSGTALAAEGRIPQIERELATAREERAAIGTPAAEPEIPCPHCGAYVVLRKVNLVEIRLEKAGEKLSASEQKKRGLAIAGLDGSIDRLAHELQDARKNLAMAQRAVAESVDAQQRLAAAPPASETTGPDSETARTNLARSEARLADYRRKVEADELHDQIEHNDKALDQLAPDGLRAKKLVQVVELWNRSDLGELARAAGWQEVRLTPDFRIDYGGRPYALLSASEQYRARAVLQVAMAKRDESQMLVFDAADILDAETRRGLFTMIAHAGFHALVCMTLSRPEQMPDLAASGYGRSYWIEGGIAVVRGINAAAA